LALPWVTHWLDWGGASLRRKAPSSFKDTSGPSRSRTALRPSGLISLASNVDGRAAMLALARGWVQVVGQTRRAGWSRADRRTLLALPSHDELIGRHDHEINGRNRRLAKNFEDLAETRATFVTLASIRLGLRGLARALA